MECWNTGERDSKEAMLNVSFVFKPVIPVFRHSNWSKNPGIPYILFSPTRVKHLEGTEDETEMVSSPRLLCSHFPRG